MARRTIKMATAFWDKSDPGNGGWAYRLRFTDGHEESGPMAAMHTMAVEAELNKRIARAGGTGECEYQDSDEGSFHWRASDEVV